MLEQLAAAEALHHDVHVLLVAAHLDHLHNVRVAELLREGALHPQRLVHLVVLELGEREHLDRHLRRAAPLRLPQVHRRLRARAELVLEGVPRRDVLERHVGEARRLGLRHLQPRRALDAAPPKLAGELAARDALEVGDDALEGEVAQQLERPLLLRAVEDERLAEGDAREVL